MENQKITTMNEAKQTRQKRLISEKLKLKLQFLLKNQMEIMENQKITTMNEAKQTRQKRLIS
ncbi:hypothetical protein, partial [Staphylococcus aureus]|uniref:hypothetical protein n=1 Tax=Staphylococcus aureus TaxID=1280 RepID=UPI003D186F84